ncbi:ataxin-7-like protein 3 [Anneissia japonica]|uniref:ataxin-7-like protein 3 n=1 Tax=Anneissia japonica TaxID=1529436 RepID=UPI001425A4D6|nr:ataxin-7-like protein 3 [Anneissia japonica]
MEGLLTAVSLDGSDSVENPFLPYTEDVFNELLDEVTLGLCFEIHRSCKIGTFFLEDVDEDSQKEYEIVHKDGLDVFGNPPQKKQLECICPNCDRNLAASRFAPHLEKCLGMGRNSSRIASRRIANKVESDNEDDETTDLSYNPDRRNTKKKRDKLSNNSPRLKSKFSKSNRNGASVSSSIDAGVIAYKGSISYRLEKMTLEERKQLLMSSCGVISEHTKKMCTKSLRCPQHTDDQRKGVRKQLLTPESDARGRFEGAGVEGDEIHVDIDSYEDGDGQALRDNLSRLQYGNTGSTNPSPADSTSTTHSNDGSTKKRKKSSKLTQRKKSKSKTPLHIEIPSQQTYEILD